MGKLLLHTFVDADARKLGDYEFYVVIGDVRFTIEKAICDRVERWIVGVVDGVMVIFIHWLSVVEAIVVHDGFWAAMSE